MKPKKITNHNLFEEVHKTIKALALICELDINDETKLEEKIEDYYKKGEQLKQAVTQLIDLQLNAYKEFSTGKGKDYMWNNGDTQTHFAL